LSKGAEAPERAEDRPAESRARRVLKVCVKAGLVLNAVMASVLLYTAFLHAQYFSLTQVDVTGVRRLSREEVVEASELRPGTNMLTVDLDHVAARLTRHPWIRSASVYRRFPGRIIIELEERRPKALLAAGKLYYVDEKGDPFTRALPGDPVDYPLLTGLNADLGASQLSETKELIKSAIGLLDLLERRGSGLDTGSVSEIALDVDRGLTIVTHGGRTLALGADNLAVKLERYERLKRFLTQRKEWNNARIIDLDFEDRALVRTGNGRPQG
jgi:cell division septal protein FtsQ